MRTEREQEREEVAIESPQLSDAEFSQLGIQEKGDNSCLGQAFRHASVDLLASLIITYGKIEHAIGCTVARRRWAFVLPCGGRAENKAGTSIYLLH